MVEITLTWLGKRSKVSVQCVGNNVTWLWPDLVGLGTIPALQQSVVSLAVGASVRKSTSRVWCRYWLHA